jgi:Rod binding domain-containing protein
MSVAPLNALSAADQAPIAGSAVRPVAAKQTDAQKVAAQFEAILVRQMIGPAIESAMGGGGQAGGGGGGTYSYMLTDTIANQLTAGRGLGLAPMIAQQLTPRGIPVPNPDSL